MRFGIIEPKLFFVGLEVDGLVAPLSAYFRGERPARDELRRYRARGERDAMLYRAAIDVDSVELVAAATNPATRPVDVARASLKAAAKVAHG